MSYTINRSALQEFVSRQAALVEATPLPADLATLAPLDGVELGADELHAVWLGAGLATQIGLALMEAPERFINEPTTTRTATR